MSKPIIIATVTIIAVVIVVAVTVVVNVSGPAGGGSEAIGQDDVTQAVVEAARKIDATRAEGVELRAAERALTRARNELTRAQARLEKIDAQLAGEELLPGYTSLERQRELLGQRRDKQLAHIKRTQQEVQAAVAATEAERQKLLSD